MSRWAVLLAGGSGTRFWPLSTAVTPKQMLALAGHTPLLVQAFDRLAGLIPPERVLVVTSRSLREHTARLLPSLPPGNVLAEPRPASTAPALTWATTVAAGRDPDATILSLHADWVVGDDRAFRQTAEEALSTAERHDVLVTVGIVPTRPEPGYGHIVPGEVLERDIRTVQRFVEKPSAERATELTKAGALWNSGLFAWTANRFLAEARDCAPELAPHLELLRLEDVSSFFDSVTPIAVDLSHYERSSRVAVVPGRFPWDDVGTWSALSRVRPSDDAGNTIVGEVFQLEASGSVAWADDGPIVMYGTENAVVVRANGVVLVTTRERAATLKELFDVLPPDLRDLTP